MRQKQDKAALATCSAALSLLLVGLACSSCKSLAMNVVAGALTGEGNSEVFAGDSDPELVGEALPFAIKMYESLLAGNPNHEGLIVTTGSLFIMYANAFVQGPSELLPSWDERREAAKVRAKALYLRGVGILQRGLERRLPRGDLAKAKKKDAPLLYWTVAGTVAAYSLDPFDLDLGVRLPQMKSLMDRAYELDPDFNNGALDDFYLLLYASLPEDLGGDKSKARIHFERAVAKSRGLSAGPYVSYAQALAIPAQDYETFKAMLDRALAIDVDQDPANRLANILAQRKARYLLETADHYFPDLLDSGDDFDGEGDSPKGE